ncbi:CsbD family protein [Chitinimonas viridis]|uniref:CsbD family protein n=1 Tax=Chitinimonas viridis TaxID=664880 RepID=A0ABT8B049_9NEIS|nr:CsbD family protein [Chitinimonas viridis]MDN3575481.1 CsbD family protein [Chitinimonas viridis]
MNWDIVESNWKHYQGKVKAHWSKLTDKQLALIAGQRVELVGKIQEAYGITKDEAEQEIRRFELRNKVGGPTLPL